MIRRPMRITPIRGLILIALLLAMVGCKPNTAQKLPHWVTFQSEAKAPAQFDAWSFYWLAPVYDPEARLEAIILQPDGKEYCRFIASTMPGGGRMRSDFLKGIPGGDPATLAGDTIRFVLHVNHGDMFFYPHYRYGFAFYTKSDSGGVGDIDWDKPFRFIPAVTGETR